MEKAIDKQNNLHYALAGLNILCFYPSFPQPPESLNLKGLFILRGP